MNYTREPIIETVITPKEGYKLILRNSKGSDREEYAVDAIEVVSFGNSFFFRSLERPKSFLVPVSDYEVVEAKETRVVLKNASFERSIKIGGGREAGVKAGKEKATEKQAPAAVDQQLEKKRERKRHRRRRSGSEEEKESEVKVEGALAEEGKVKDEDQTPSVPPRPLIPPPSHLIADKLPKQLLEEEGEVKIPSEPVAEATVSSESVAEAKPKATAEPKSAEKPKRGRRKKKVEPVAEEKLPAEEPITSPEEERGSEMQRVATELTGEAVSSTSFSAEEEKGKFSFFGKTW